MVITRSQANRTNESEQARVDTFSDDESNSSLPNLYTNNCFTDDNGTYNANQEREHEKARINRGLWM